MDLRIMLRKKDLNLLVLPESKIANTLPKGLYRMLQKVLFTKLQVTLIFNN